MSARTICPFQEEATGTPYPMKSPVGHIPHALRLNAAVVQLDDLR
jgi:hypothetical protein